MSTIALRCPYCGGWMRVAAQASLVEKTDQPDQLRVEFSAVRVAHLCRREENGNGEAKP